MAQTVGLLETLARTTAAFVEGECDLWQRLAGAGGLLHQGLREGVAQARKGEREAWDLVERCWRSLGDPRCAEEIEAFYRLDPDFERARIDCARLHRNGCGLAATARMAMAAWYCAGDDDQPLLLGCAQEAATILSGRSGEGIDGLGVADRDPVVTVHRSFDILARSGWLVAGARLWTLTWLDSPWERRSIEVPVAGYHPQERGFLADLHLGALDGEGELVEAPDRSLHPFGPELVTAVRETWAQSGSSPSLYWCLTVRSGGLPPWLPLDGPSLAGPMAVGLRLLNGGGRYDGASVVLGQPADDGCRLEPVGFEREKLEAVVEWNREHSADNPETLLRRAAVSPGTSLARQDLEALRIRGLPVAQVKDLKQAAQFVRPSHKRRVAALALGAASVLAGSVALQPWSHSCPAQATITVAAMWSGEEQDRFDDVLEKFCRETGFRVQYNDVSDGEMPEYLDQMDPPDVAMVPQPGLIRELVADQRLQPLGTDASKAIEENYPPLAQKFMRVEVEGPLYGVWFKASNKSLWWYHPKALEERGIEPQSAWTWKQMLDAARDMKEAGVPWLAIGAADGWPLTDLFENLYLRTAGSECYDALSVHAIGWDHHTVVEALTMMRDLFQAGRVADDTLRTNFRSSVVQVFGGQSKAATLYGADFVLSVIQSETSAEAEEDFDYFDFPAVLNSDPAVIAGGDIAVAFTATPGVQSLLTFLASPDAAAIWARRGGFVSPNLRLNPPEYRDAMTERAAQSLTQHMTGDGSLRFDLSDLQPPAFGATLGDGLQSNLQKLLNNGDPEMIADELERDADAAYGSAPWEELVAQSAGLDCAGR